MFNPNLTTPANRGRISGTGAGAGAGGGAGAAAANVGGCAPVLADRVLEQFGAFGRPRSSVTPALRDALLVVAGAAIVGALAQVSVPLWPVPITGQTLGVMLVGAALGARRGTAAMLTYLLLGLVGMPWFSGFSGGLAAVAKPSFGYIIGFIPTAFVIGWLAQRSWDRRPYAAMAAFGVASIIPFLFGVPYLWLVLNLAGKTVGFAGAISLGFTPFIVGGIIKWAIGAALLPSLWRLVGKAR